MASIRYMQLLLNRMFSSLRTEVEGYLSHMLATDFILLLFNIPQMEVKVIFKKTHKKTFSLDSEKLISGLTRVPERRSVPSPQLHSQGASGQSQARGICQTSSVP